MMWYNNWNMMSSTTGVLGIFTWFVILVDLVLLGIWLWKQISK